MAPAPRKRTRKRKRRAAVSSSESDSSSDSPSSNESAHPPTSLHKPIISSSSSSDSDSDSDSSDSSSSSSDASLRAAKTKTQLNVAGASAPKNLRHLSSSPSPPPADLPSFLPVPGNSNNGDRELKEQEMKDRFRQFWMASVSDAFKDDLEEIRKEHDFGATRLGLLIDALASGTEVFKPEGEMEVVLE